MLNLSRLHSYDWGTSAASGTSVGGMTPGRVKRLERHKAMVDFMQVDQGRAWPEYKSIGQANIYV
jgi:hypothetical protein